MLYHGRDGRIRVIAVGIAVGGASMQLFKGDEDLVSETLTPRIYNEGSRIKWEYTG